MASFDILIIGAGISGCALAHGLSKLPREKPLRIGVVERSLAEPDRIVGELLQPGGRMALDNLGLEWCTEGIDSITTNGYCVVEGGKAVHIPYPGTYEGRCFHHGRFIMRLREAARQAKGVELIEATVTELVENEVTKKIHGVRITKKGTEEIRETLYADLVVVADGCFSNFRNQVMGGAAVAPVTKSHFIGAILEDVKLPIPNHGTVCLTKGYGPVLLYQISEHDTRMLVDVKAPLPADLKVGSVFLC
jgi:squalene monooxygenase